MSLLSRLATFPDDIDIIDAIPKEQFISLLVMLSKGLATRADIIAFYALDESEVAEMEWVIDQYNSRTDPAQRLEFTLSLSHTLNALEAMTRDQGYLLPGFRTVEELAATIAAL